MKRFTSDYYAVGRGVKIQKDLSAISSDIGEGDAKKGGRRRRWRLLGLVYFTERAREHVLYRRQHRLL